MKDIKLTETFNQFIVTGIAQCDHCGGQGLYQGFAEKDGAAVVCIYCKGSGKEHVKVVFDKFKGRKTNPKIKRVYTNGMGYGITDKDVTVEGKFMPFSQFGCTYKEWLDGKKPLPIKFLGCPYQETGQELQSKDVNNLYKTRCSANLGYGFIGNCKLRHDMATCWEIYEARHV